MKLFPFVFKGGGSQKAAKQICREVVREDDDLRETYKLNDKEVDVASRSRDNLVMRVRIQVKRQDVEIL